MIDDRFKKLDKYMKYLKKFSEFIITPSEKDTEGKNKEILNNINDICLELSDDGYYVLNNFFENDGKYSGNSIMFRKEDNSIFFVKDILDTVIRIDDYLRSVGFHVVDISTNLSFHNAYVNGYWRWVNNAKKFKHQEARTVTLYIKRN